MLPILKPVILTMLVVAQGDGNKLLAICEGDNDKERGVCMVYIEGVTDEWRFVNYLTEPDKPVCAADAVGKQLRDVVVNYLKAHPENRNDPAAALITDAITDAWHCSG
jgi:Ssp1 endopeptidase immunity protein Rap1a